MIGAMIWFQCDDCGDRVKKSQLPRHFRFCSATKFSCVECGNMFEQDSVQYHEQCITGAELSKRSSWFCSLCNVNSTCERDFFKHVNGRKHRAEELDLADKQKRQAGQPTVDKENSKQQPNFDITVGLSNCDPWLCSLCNSKSTSQQSLLDHAYGRKHRANVEEFNANQQQRQSESFIVDKKDNSKQQTEVDINVGLSNCYPWFCSLCNTNSTSQQSLLDHANGRKHRANVEEFDANRQQRQSEPSIVDKKNNSKQQTEVDINVGLSNCYPWFCSVCNIKATCKQNLLAHANGWKHRENIKYFAVEQQQYSEQSTVEKKDTIENASNGNSEQKKVASPVPSGVGNEYSLVDKKRKLQTFDETWKGEVIQAEEAKGGSERSRESKKAKKQSELDSDFENDREDIKLLLVSYSKEELVNLVYKTAEEGSRLISAILESADLDINQRNIFVRGFGWDITQGNLKAAFESYGEIEDCSVIMDKITGRGKGYGFVLFKTWKGARMALKNPQKRMFNRMVECNLASAKPCRAEKPHDLVEPVKIDLTSSANQSEVVLPRLELAHGHVLDRREQQQTMEMFGQNMPFYGHSQLPGFDPMYGALRGSQMFSGPPSSSMFGPSMMNQGSMLPPPTHMDMAGQYFGDGEQALVRAQALTPSPFHVANPESAVVIFNPSLVQESMPPPTNVAASSPQVDGVTVLQGPKLVSSTPGVAAVSGGVDPSHSLSTKEDKDDVTVCSPRRVSRASSPFLGDFEERGEAFVPFHSQNQVQEGQSSVNPVIDLTEDLPESKRVVRRSGMRKRKDKSDLSAPPAKVSRPSRSSSRSTRSDYDSSLFSSFEAMERYRFYSADPRIHKEQVKYISSSEENIRNLIARASLLSTVDSVVEYDLDVLLEFWSNLPPITPGEHSVNVFVRGHLYEFSVARINSLFGLPDVDDRDGNAEMARVYPADLAVIVTGGKKTVWDKGISPSFIEPYTSLYPICCSNWDPTTNTLYVKLGRVQLMYKLVHKIPFNFGKSVFDQILRIAHTPQSNLYLPFPSLITRLLTSQRPVPPRPIQSSTHRTTPRQGNVTSDASPGSNDHLRRVLAAVITMCQDALRAGGEGDEQKFFDDQADQDLSD